MKRILSTSLFVALLPTAVFSQQHISYAYDASGNRTQRQTAIQQHSIGQQKALSPSSHTELDVGDHPIVCHMQESGHLTIKATTALDAACSYAVFHTDGALVCRGVLPGAGTHTVINMEGYAPGVYVVTATVGDNKHIWKVTKK